MKKIFIGSSSQALDKARLIQFILEKLGAETTLWQDFNVFPPSGYSFESLLRAAHEHSGGVFLFDRDDQVSGDTDGTSKWLPRDNVILEAGIFAGVLGQRSIAFCKAPDVHQATDLDGMTYVPYDPVHMEDMEKKLGKWLNDSVKDYWDGRFDANVLMRPRTEIHQLYSIESRFHIEDSEYKNIRYIRIMNLAGNLIINPKMADNGHVREMRNLRISDVIGMMLSETDARVEYISAEPNRCNLTDVGTKIANCAAGGPKAAVLTALQALHSKLSSDTIYREKYMTPPIQFYLYLMKISMPFAILNVEFENPKYNHVKVDLYSPALDNEDDRRSFVIRQEDDPVNYQFFVDNFNHIKMNRSICTEMKGEAGLQSLNKWIKNGLNKQ